MVLIWKEISVSKRKECKSCKCNIDKDTMVISAISSVFYGHANSGYLCRECFLMLVDDFDPKVLKKSVKDKIEQIRVARKV
jgi:hypothetical protein